MLSRRNFLHLTGAGALTLAASGVSPLRAADAAPRPKRTPRRPNIVCILADDLGYGDVQALGFRSKIPTPNLNRLVREGRTFTDAHAGAAVCTPSRYGLLTGRYCWRTRLKRSVLFGYCETPLIEKSRMTVASYLKTQGYDTAAFGKWHLGMLFASTNGKRATPTTTDWNGPIDGGPCDIGFDVYQGVPNTPNQPPFVWVNNRRFEQAATATLSSGQPGFERGHCGPAAPDYECVRFFPELVERIDTFLTSRKRDRPLFLYYAAPAPHTPIVPSPEFQGKSGISPYADYCMQLDDAVGRLLRRLDALGMAKDTLVIFTSDNGCAPMPARVHDLEKAGHFVSHIYRGYKTDIYEGGHRMPFIARWPGVIPADTQCSEPLCLTDLLATVAELTGGSLPDNAGEDSVSMLPALLGEPTAAPLREAMIHHSIRGTFAIRRGRWKYCENPGSGGISKAAPWPKSKGPRPKVQLFDIESDPCELRNVCNEYPQVVRELQALLDRCRSEGRSVPHRN